MSVSAAILAVCCLAAVSAAEPTELIDSESRFLFNSTSDINVGVTPNTLLVSLGLGSILVMGALLVYLILTTGGEEELYSGYSTGTGYSGHSAGGQTSYSHARGAADTWSALSAIDWIALAQELYESADELRSRPCQQRLVCQLAAGVESSSSGAARAAGTALDYLSYLQLVRLPADVQQTVQQLGDAARSGRGVPADCELRYSSCSLSVRQFMDKITPAATS
ncbi:hypothetical protein FJT64_018824 [Amphibalanus amphitrite]|uniref:Uncharacterized protein n=1 Tax=Amphibalanus amphitrite TaxID=1232801 RepID=A0A6A4WVU9_AMPAM|nr:hypothetical protein FJT64_018824 [Amphibalanus amphitrite]